MHEAPLLISDVNFNVSEDTSPGSVIGSIQMVDPDWNNPIQFVLTNAEESTLNLSHVDCLNQVSQSLKHPAEYITPICTAISGWHWYSLLSKSL